MDKHYVLDMYFSTFLCGVASVLHRKAVSVLQYCNICNAQESHKGNTVLPEVQKIVGCVTSWKTGGLDVIWALCIAGSFVRPVFISGSERVTNMEKVCLPSAVGSCQKCGWAVEELFVVWS